MSGELVPAAGPPRLSRAVGPSGQEPHAQAAPAGTALEAERRHRLRMEAVGRLTAGVAHEINTPLQYVGDLVYFFQDACEALGELLSVGAELLQSDADTEAAVARLRARYAAEPEALAFFASELPEACRSAAEGVRRVTEMVAALKELSHPSAGEKAPADLNRTIRTALTLARSEYKYVADLHTELAELPPLRCCAAEIGQAVLNLVVNAAQAVAERVEAEGGRGTIWVSSRLEDAAAVIRVRDTGRGVSDEVRRRLFEPFFTTKPPGVGTGQGLPLVREIVEVRHGGRVVLESGAEEGASFALHLPLADPAG